MLQKWIKTLVWLILSICVWMGIAPDYYHWYLESNSTVWLRELCSFLDGRWLVMVPVCLVLSYVAYLWAWRILCDKDIRPFRIGLIVGCLVLLNFRYDIEYPRVVGDIRLNTFISILLIICAICFVVKVIRSIWSRNSEKNTCKRENNNDVSFTVDRVEGNVLPRHVKKYATVLADQLLNTIEKDKQSFAIGVTGEWGSGKTTFLNVLKECIGDRAEVLDFNPWMCQGPEQMTRDFFSSLRHQLSKYYSTLAKPISHYARYLERVRFSFGGMAWLDSAGLVKTPSLYNIKAALSARFDKLPRPVVVCIDDIDRLESKEVFEVLRLIRNTADIRNVVYVTTLDKEYVINVLRNGGCDDAASYLEKIFPIEVHLPKPESFEIWELFVQELVAQDFSGGGIVRALVNNFNAHESTLILKVLTNYRKARRFSRLFMLNLRAMQDNHRGDYQVRDLFWLELLQFYDKHIYDLISGDISVLMYYKPESKYYVLREGVMNETCNAGDPNRYTGERIWKSSTPGILNILFGKYRNRVTRSICYEENYMRYFTLGLSDRRLSSHELECLLKCNGDYESVIDGWIQKNKFLLSIESNLLSVKHETLCEKEQENFLNGVLYYSLQKQSWSNSKVDYLKDILNKSRLKDISRVESVVSAWIKKYSRKIDSLQSLASLVSKLYATEYFECGSSKSRVDIETVISNNEIETWLKDILKTYLNRNKESVTAVDIFKKDTQLYKIFGSCCVRKRFEEYTDHSEYEQIGFEVIIEYFSKVKIKSSMQEFDDQRNSIFQEGLLDEKDFENPYEYGRYIEVEAERYEDRMTGHFGSNRNKDLEKFRSECFQQVVEKRLREKTVKKNNRGEKGRDNNKSGETRNNSSKSRQGIFHGQPKTGNII